MPSPPPEISVVMPCYNAAKTLRHAIESIRGQSFLGWELIIIDDGSTDNSPAILEAYAAEDDRIHPVHEIHGGIVRALQKGCARARGRYIARMDADDIALPQRFEKQHQYMQKHPNTALCGTHVSMFGAEIGEGRKRYEKWLNSLRKHEDIVRDLFIECPIPHPTFFLRRESFERVGGYEDHDWPEDYDLCMRLFLENARFGMVPETLLQWRESSDRLSMTAERYSLGRFRALKRAYLGRSYLEGRSGFYQWGAGEVGKTWLREWQTIKPQAVADIHPRKIGREIHEIPVIAPDDLPSPGTTFIIIAVGAPGAREEIRAWLSSRGYVELRDFVFVA